MSSSAKCNILFFIKTGTARYLVDVFTFPFLNHSHGGRFKVPIIIIIIIIIILLFVRFLHQPKLMIFHCSLNDNKSPQV